MVSRKQGRALMEDTVRRWSMIEGDRDLVELLLALARYGNGVVLPHGLFYLSSLRWELMYGGMTRKAFLKLGYV